MTIMIGEFELLISDVNFLYVNNYCKQRLRAKRIKALYKFIIIIIIIINIH